MEKVSVGVHFSALDEERRRQLQRLQQISSIEQDLDTNDVDSPGLMNLASTVAVRFSPFKHSHSHSFWFRRGIDGSFRN